MKKHLILFFLFACHLQVQAQEQEATTYDQQIGINTTALIGQIFNFTSSSSISPVQYFLVYRKKNKKGNFRFGFGGNFLVDEKINGTDTNIDLNFRLGQERFTDFAKRWRVYYGMDFKTILMFEKFGGIDTSQSEFFFGGGPMCGLQFNINSRLSISTEASYDFFLSIEDVNGEVRIGGRSGFQVPDFLYLNFDF